MLEKATTTINTLETKLEYFREAYNLKHFTSSKFKEEEIVNKAREEKLLPKPKKKTTNKSLEISKALINATKTFKVQNYYQ